MRDPFYWQSGDFTPEDVNLLSRMNVRSWC